MQTEMQTLMTTVEVAGGSPSAELVAELGRACDLAEDARGAVIVLRVRGGAGARRAEPDIHLFTQWERVVRRLEKAPAVTIAVAEGPCGWFETGVLLAADYRIARHDVALSLRDAAERVVPGMGVHRLATQLGAARARRLVLFAQQLSADEALALGLLDEIVDEPEPATAAAAETLAQLDAADLAVRRRLLLEASSRSFEDALGTHLAARERSVRRASSVS